MSANSIMSVFAKSPLKPIEEHIKLVHKTSEHLIQFFQHVFVADWTQANRAYEQIAKLERDADTIKREVRLQLPSGLFLPVERTDLLELLTQQDKIANRAKDIAGRVIGRELVIPQSLQASFDAYIKRCVDATGQASITVNEFDALLESGFRGREVTLVESLVDEIDSIEADTDKLQISLRLELKGLEAQLNPIDVMFLYNIIDWIGDLADLAEKVGARLELMLAR